MPTNATALLCWLALHLMREEDVETARARADVGHRLTDVLASPAAVLREELRRVTTRADRALLVRLARRHEERAMKGMAEWRRQETDLAIRYRSATQLLALLEEPPPVGTGRRRGAWAEGAPSGLIRRARLCRIAEPSRPRVAAPGRPSSSTSRRPAQAWPATRRRW